MMRWITIFSVLLLALGCARDDHITEYQVETPVSDADNTSDAHSKGVGLHWSLPDGWKEVESTSSMRMASFVMEGVEGSDVSVSKFPGNAGGAVANVNRWRGQIGMPQGAPEDIAASMTDGQSGAGPYQYVALVNPDNAEQAFLAAILPFGDSTVFIKAAIPAGAVETQTASFVSFCNSLHAAGPGHSH